MTVISHFHRIFNWIPGNIAPHLLLWVSLKFRKIQGNSTIQFSTERNMKRDNQKSLFDNLNPWPNHIKDCLQDNLLNFVQRKREKFSCLPTFNYNYSPGLTGNFKRFITFFERHSNSEIKYSRGVFSSAPLFQDVLHKINGIKWGKWEKQSISYSSETMLDIYF